MTVLTSRDNPRVRYWSKLVRNARYRREQNRALVEGPHLLAALLGQGLKPLAVVATEAGLAREEIKNLVAKTKLKPVLVSESLFRALVDAENPPGIAAEIAIPEASQKVSRASVFLEGVQDPSNVGAILRSAAAFGIGEVLLDRGCADPWSPKALRAGMGGHFRLRVRESPGLAVEVERFDGKLVCTVPRGGIALHEADLTGRLGWLFGSEGKGVSQALQDKAALRVTIPIAPGTESLNVAAAAAICFYAAFKTPPGQ